jgi:hypothetical protein
MRQVPAALALAAAGLLLAACGGDKESSPASSKATTTATKPALAQPALDGLLLTPDELNTVMGVTGMSVQQNANAIQDDYDKKWPSECFFASGSAENPAYTGSGFTAVRLQAVTAPAPPNDPNAPPPTAVTGLVLFPSATEANAFFTASTKAWAACSDRQWTVPAEKPDEPESRMSTKPVANANGVLSLTVTGSIVGGGINFTQVCQRALTVRNNVAIDVATCGKDPGDTAVTVANQVGAKVDKG